MRTAAIIVAAGQGTRMGPGVDKLFLSLAGRPVVAHSWERLDRHPEIDEVVLVIRAGMEGAFEEVSGLVRPVKPWRCVPGGRERQDSVWAGLAAVSSGVDWVAVHDAARPCCTAELIAATLAAAREGGAAVAASKVADTLKESADGRVIDGTVDRSRLWAVQTPQCFGLEILRRALAEVRARGEWVTDDTAACERIGQPVRLVASATPNPKVTVPADVPYVEALLRLLANPAGPE